MNINSDMEARRSLRDKYASLTDQELAQLAIQHNIPHALVTEYGDYLFQREKIIAEAMRIELSRQAE